MADFRRIFDGLRVAVVVTDAAGAVTVANAAFATLVRQDAAALPGRDFASLFATRDRKRVQQNLARVGGGKAATALFDATLAGDEGAPSVSVSLQPCADAKEKSAGVVAVLQDIGAQRETDEALNLVSARLLALADVSPTGLLIETAPGDIELVNDVFCRSLALESAPQSLSGLRVWDVLARSPVVDAAALADARRHPAQAASVVLTLGDGRAVALEREPIVVEGAHGGAVWILRDEASAASAAGQGAAEIAVIHQIGEELSVALEGISAVAMRAQQLDFDPAMIERVQRIRASTETAMAAVGELVDFSRVSGGVTLRKAPFDLRPALAQLIARVSQGAQERGCRLRMKVEQDVADALEGDVERLQMVLKNLLESAFALLPGAEITLQITPEYTTESGIQLSFAVLAAGTAAQQAAARAVPDAGMGVALAKYMVAAMGGTLAIASRPGAEALYGFSTEFPVRPAPPAPPRPTYVSLVAMPVLVVSADAEQRRAVSGVLRGFRMLPLEADNAPMAIALLERLADEGSPVPLVIASNRLPVQDGFLLAFRIKHHPSLRDTLVMMLATEGRPGDAIACRENGISAYMRYPISDRQLNEAIVAVTGASVDADETPTLVTRHSLREQRKGATVLLVDPHRDSQILAAHILGRHDCSVVVAQDVAEAIGALEQDVYDLVLVDAALAGLEGEDAARSLRARLARNAQATRLVAASAENGAGFRRAMKEIGFDATVDKPFKRDELLALIPAKP
ncbi:MAG: response regulator [Betaproteobacteria bacterium]